MSPPPQPKRDRRPSNPEVYEPDLPNTEVPRRPLDETPETAAERAEARRMEVRGELARGRVDISLDTLQYKARDLETPKEINEINFFESPEVQRPRLEALRDVSIIMIANLLHADHDLEKKVTLSSFADLVQLGSHLSKIRMGPAENAAWHKLQELAGHSNSDVAVAFIQGIDRKTGKKEYPSWQELVAVVRDVERDMRALETADLRSRHAPEEKGVVSKTVNFVKKHPLISLGLALAGAGLIYKAISGIRNAFSPSPSEKKERTGFMGWFVGVGATILAIFGLGKFLGKDGVKNFFKEKMGWNLDSSRAIQALTLISQGKFKEAWEVAWEGVDDKADFHQKMADHITKDMKSRVAVSGKTLFELSDDSFENCMHGFAQTQDDVSMWARKYGGNFVSFLGFDSKRKNEEQIVVRNFLKKHEVRMRQMMKKNGKEIDEDTTIGEILQAWHQYEIAPGAPGSPEASEPGSVDTVIETDPGKSGIGIDGKEAAALRERFKNKSNFQKFLEKYDGNWAGAVTSPGQFLDDLFSACNKDGIPVVLAEGSIFLLDADMAILFSSVGLLWDTAVNLVAAPFTDKVGWSDAVGTYMSGAAKFVVIGAVGKGVIDKFTGKGFLSGAWKGAKKGLLFPVEIPRLHVTAGQWIYRTARGAQFEVRKMMAGKEIALQILEEQARFHGEIARSYDRLVGSADAPLLKRNWYAWYTKDRAEKLRQRHLRRFRSAYNELQEKRAKMGLPRESEISTTIVEGESRMERVNKFLDEAESIEVARPIDVKGPLFREADGKFRARTDIEDHAARLKTELTRDISDAEKRVKQRELLALEAYLDADKKHSFEITDSDFEKLDDAAKVEKVRMKAAELEAMEKGVQARFDAEVEKIVANARGRKPPLPLSAPEVTAELEKVDDGITIPFAGQKQTAVEALNKAYEAIPKNKRTPLLISQMKHAIDGNGTFMTRMAKEAKGRGKMMVLMASLIFATDQIIHRNDTDREFHDIMREMGPDMGQLFLDVLPLVGTGSNFYSAFSGREIVSERDVSSAWDRTSNVIWGCVGLAGDIVTVLTAIPSGGGSIAASVALKLAKAGPKGARLLKMWPRISRVADRMGGLYEFAKKAKNYIGAKPQVLKGLRRIQKVGMAAGTAMLAGGITYSLYYGFADSDTEIELPSDLQAS